MANGRSDSVGGNGNVDWAACRAAQEAECEDPHVGNYVVMDDGQIHAWPHERKQSRGLHYAIQYDPDRYHTPADALVDGMRVDWGRLTLRDGEISVERAAPDSGHFRPNATYGGRIFPDLDLGSGKDAAAALQAMLNELGK